MAGPDRFYNARRSCASTGTPVRHKREKTMGTGSWTAVAAPASTALVFSGNQRQLEYDFAGRRCSHAQEAL